MSELSQPRNGYAITKKAIGEHLNLRTHKMEPRHEIGRWMKTQQPEICGACFRSIQIGHMAVQDISGFTLYCENCVMPTESLTQALTLECDAGELPRIQMDTEQQAKANYLRTGHYRKPLISVALEKAFQKNKHK
jgi:hypothetical protein